MDRIASDESECAAEISNCLESSIDRRLEAGDDVDSPGWYRGLIDEATRRMGTFRGVSTEDWSRESDVADQLGDELDSWPTDVWRDPHALGWIHEGYAARARRDSFDGHVHREKKHSSATVTTQLYTPRWIADALVDEALELWDGEEFPQIIDPAVGAGQMLLAALSTFAKTHPDAEPADWVRPLWGVDLDERAVDVARRTLALEIARRVESRDRDAEEILHKNITVGDGLTFGSRGEWDLAVTNPPFMGWRSMPDELRDQLDPRFRPYHRDLYSAFIARCHELASGAVGVLAQQSIWYLRRFEKARRDLLERGDIAAFLHLGAGAFWNLNGEKASVVAFVQQSEQPDSTNGSEVDKTRVWDLRSAAGAEEKRTEYSASVESVDDESVARQSGVMSTFDVATTRPIPGRPMCHDLSPQLRNLFEELPPLRQFAEVPGSQHKTGKNRRYVRDFRDVDESRIRRVDEFGERGVDDGRWVFYSKGGRFAPWWGNWQWVVDWSEEARRFYRENRTSNLLDEKYRFRPGIVYTDFGGKRFNARLMPPGCLFDMTGPAVFPTQQLWPGIDDSDRIAALLGVLNSSAARRMLKALNPTLHFQVRDVRALPVPAIDTDEATSLAGEVRALVHGVKSRVAHHEDSPLDPARWEQRMDLEELVNREEAIDRIVRRAYGVDCRPIPGATIREHHQIA